MTIKNSAAKPRRESYNEEYWIGVAFLPLGLVFTILGLSSPGFLATGIPFLVLGLLMMARGASRRRRPETADELELDPEVARS